MGKKKSTTAATIETTTRAIEHSGHSITVNGKTIDIPLSVEAAGPEAVQDYLAEQCAIRGVNHVPEQPTAPAPTTKSESAISAPNFILA